MQVRSKMVWGGVCVAATVLIACIILMRGQQPRLNILVITLDTTRADRLGCYGYPRAETPHLDSLAQRGILFERAYAPAPMTAPSHTSMFTGLWPPEHGVVTNGQTSLLPGIPILAELVKQVGYHSAAFVSAFVLQSRFGLSRGFEHYDDDLSTASPEGDELHRYRDGKLVIDSACRWLQKSTSRPSPSPFLCWVHLYDPHEPYLLHPDEFGNRFDNQPYDGELAYTDLLVGRLLKTLDELGIRDKTYILVVGDHGESLGEHGELTHGFTLHESTLRVPLIVVDPRIQSPGRRVTQPVPLVDLFPTLLNAAGAPVPPEISGRSLQPALSGQPLEPRTCYSLTDEPYLQAFWSPLRGLTTERWRYVRSTRPELYDLTADPSELVNLAVTNSDVLNDLENELAIFEEKLRLRSGENVELSAQDRRALESLGYTGGPARAALDLKGQKELPDIKDMLVHLNGVDEAIHLIEQKKFDAAAVILEPIASTAPNFIRARLNLGLCRMIQQNYEEAEKWFKLSLEIDPHSDRAHDMLGFTYLKLQKLDLAELHFQELLKLRPDSETGNLFLGEVYQRRGDARTALHYYTTVLRINPGNRAAQEGAELMHRALRSP
ncbi:sulfatase-like hydrolase/transferase [Schlesneria sp.]|uniref:sulfatase-like hydrolase/transferase n=1 Tax=Schlesneria sp. TaxID=2762018 RepID=UPI002EDEBF30